MGKTQSVDVTYYKVKAGRKWALARPSVGEKNALRIVATFDCESECRRVLSLIEGGMDTLAMLSAEIEAEAANRKLVA